MEDLRRLWELQKIDNVIQNLREQEEEIPKEIESLQKEVEDKESHLGEIKEESEKVVQRRRSFERVLEETQDRIRRHKAQLLNVKTNREYSALISEITVDENKVAQYEEKVFDALTQSEELVDEIKELEKALSEEKKKFEEKKTSLEKQLDETKKSLAAQENKRKNVQVKINSVILDKYERIRDKRAGSAVVPVKGSICSGCHTFLPPQFVSEIRRAQRLLTCEQCGRILIWEDDES